MAVKRRPRVCWDNVERGVRLTLRIAAEVVRLIIEIRSGRLAPRAFYRDADPHRQVEGPPHVTLRAGQFLGRLAPSLLASPTHRPNVWHRRCRCQPSCGDSP